MNIQRFILPGSIAAAAHVALFLALPAGSWVRPGKIIDIIDPPIYTPIDISTPPEDPAPSDTPVTPLAGGPTLPTLAEPPPMLTHCEIPLQVDDWQKKPVTTTTTIPFQRGDNPIGTDFPRPTIFPA